VKLAKEVYKEVGKYFLSVSLAFVVFTLIQPFVQNKLNPKLLLIGGINMVVFFALGIYFLNKGGKDEP